VEVKIMIVGEKRKQKVGNYQSERNEDVSDVGTLEINQLEKIQIATR
jgi:hypothetical protein